MSTTIDATLSLKSENIAVQKKSLAATESSQSTKRPADQWSPIYQTLSVATIMYMIADLIAKQSMEMRKSTLQAQLHTGKAYVDQAASALKDQLRGLDKDLKSNLGINRARIVSGAMAVVGVFGGHKVGLSPEVVARITTQGNILETGSTAYYMPGQTEAQQISRKADLTLTLNNTSKDTRERLTDFTRQMDMLLSKSLTTFQESYQMLSRVFQMR